MAPYMPAPMNFIPDMHSDSRSAPPRDIDPAHPHTVSFHDQLGTMSPSMLHTARPRGGMRGAPELAPEDIGNVAKFNDFLQRHASYAASAREQNQSWASVAGLLSRYAEDLAVAFNACALKRQEPPHFDAHIVLQLSDDTFERLYLEACAPSVEYPSQVLQVLESIAFLRQQPHETNPMPAILRAAEAFRVQLRLLPSRAVSECKDDALAMAFMTLLFGDSAKHRSNDFQRCTSWIQLKDALIRSAASNPSWFGTALHPSATTTHPTAPAQSTPSSQHSTSTSASQPSTDPQEAKRMADRVARMKASGELKGLEIEGLSDKSILKLVNKAKWRTKIGNEAVEQARAAGTLGAPNKLQEQMQEQAKAIAALTAQLRQRSDSRDRHHDRPRDDRARDDRPRDDRPREDRYLDRPRSGDRSVERPRSQEPPSDPKTPPRSQAFAPNTSPSASQRQSSPGPRRT
jgi:hypothetical protein